MRAWEERLLNAAHNPPGVTVDLTGRLAACRACDDETCSIRANWGRNCGWVKTRLARANTHCPLGRF